MLLRLLRGFNAWYALVIFWGYLAAFALAFTMVIVFFPVGSLTILFVALGLLPILFIFGSISNAAERAWSRSWLRRGKCPMCQAEHAVESVAPAALAAAPRWLEPEFRAAYACSRCGALYQRSGEPAELPIPDEPPIADESQCADAATA